VTLQESVAISGAAVDARQANVPAQQEILSAANYDLGFYIDNPLESASLGDQFGLSSRLFPLYLWHPLYGHTQFGGRVYLTDGGHSETAARSRSYAEGVRERSPSTQSTIHFWISTHKGAYLMPYDAN